MDYISYLTLAIEDRRLLSVVVVGEIPSKLSMRLVVLLCFRGASATCGWNSCTAPQDLSRWMMMMVLHMKKLMMRFRGTTSR